MPSSRAKKTRTSNPSDLSSRPYPARSTWPAPFDLMAQQGDDTLLDDPPPTTTWDDREWVGSLGKVARWGIVTATIVGGLLGASNPSTAQEATRTFTETGKSVSGKFLTYWDNHGGLAQQGFPISQQMQEKSDLDGKVYTTQYFQRAVFEHHPENQPPHDVLLSQLGTFQMRERYPNGAPGQQPNNESGSVLMTETGKRIGGKFLDYWKNHGGLPQQGYPISEQLREKSATDGKEYLVQYFERAVMEYHPEYAGTPNEVLLSLLGTFQYEKKYDPDGSPKATTTTTPTVAATRTPEATAIPGKSASVDLKNEFGDITIDGGETFDFKSNNDPVLSRMFKQIHDATGKQGKVDAHFKFLPNGDTLYKAYKNNEPYKGAKVHSLNMINGFEFYMTEKNDKDEYFTEISPLDLRGGDNMQNLNTLYHMESDADGGKTYVSVEWTKRLLEMYGNIDITEVRPRLGEDLFAYLKSSKDQNGKYIYPGNPPLEAIRK